MLGWTDLSPRRRLVAVVRIALLLAAALGLLVLAWIIPGWQAISAIPEAEIKSVNVLEARIESIKTTAQIIIGALVFFTLWVAWRRANAADRTAESAQQTVRVAQEGQITERFTKAVEQFGNSESTAIRLGGIYALVWCN